jgi:hypothetical protein
VPAVIRWGLVGSSDIAATRIILRDAAAQPRDRGGMRGRPAVCMLDPLCRTHDVDDWQVVDSVCFPASAATGPAVTPRRE